MNKLTYKPAKIHHYDVQELIQAMFGLDEEVGYDTLEELLYERYEICLDSFEKIVKDLAPLARHGQSPLTKEINCGFVLPNQTNCFVIKHNMEVNNEPEN